uniref:IS110 family transposase n=1 Tax=Ascaris lumbricoides TaxID=6252 RepID=A0A0M3HLX1_ASCLU
MADDDRNVFSSLTTGFRARLLFGSKNATFLGSKLLGKRPRAAIGVIGSVANDIADIEAQSLLKSCR